MLSRLLSPLREVRLWASCMSLWANCVRTSQRLHSLYKKVRAPLHGCYFASAWTFEHGIIAYISGGLLLLVIVGLILREDTP